MITKTVNLFQNNLAGIGSEPNPALGYFLVPAGRDSSMIGSVQLPEGYDSITRIRVMVRKTKVDDVRLRFSFDAIKIEDGTRITDDTDTLTDYAIDDDDETTDFITVPTAAYNGLVGLKAGDHLSIALIRKGTVDTYNGLKVLLVSFDFSCTETVTVSAAAVRVKKVDNVSPTLLAGSGAEAYPALGIVRMPANTDSSILFSSQIPDDFESISRIRLFYRKTAIAVLRYRFSFDAVPIDGAVVKIDDSDVETSYSCATADGAIGIITIPAAAYNNLTNLAAGDRLDMAAIRKGASPEDTFSAADILFASFEYNCTQAASSTTDTKTRYCNITTDLYRAYDGIEDFKSQRSMRGWVLHSGSIYEIPNAGYGEQLFESGVQLAAARSLDDLTAGSFYYDADDDILYVYATSGLPTDAAKTYLFGIDWDTFKQSCVDRASERVESLLDRRFPRPLPEGTLVSASQKYDGPLIDAVALIACSFIVGKYKPAKYDQAGTAQNLAAELSVAGRKIIDEYNNGDLTFSWELTAPEIGSATVTPSSANTGDGMIQVRATTAQTADAFWKIKITLAGAVGTATYQLSTDNGTTYSGTDVTTSLEWVELSSGVYVRFFDRAGEFDLNDSWQIVIVGNASGENRSGVSTRRVVIA